MHIRRLCLLPMILCSMLILTACPASSGSAEARNNGAAFTVNSDTVGYAARTDYKSDYDYDEGGLDSSDTQSIQEAADDFNVEMLVYSGSVRIKTDTFEESVAAFKSDIKELGGFIEHQELDTGWNMRDTRRDIQTFTAYIRVPSSVFQQVMDSASAYGKIIDSSTDVENIARDYASATASLEVYEAKRQRYIELMSRASSVTEMVELEREVTNIEREIASYKAQLDVMNLDMAYSTINVTISNRIDDLEVAEDTFLSRVGKALSDSIRWFLRFLENLVIFIILYWWYVAFFVLVVVFIRFIHKKWREKHPPKPVVKPTERVVLKPDDFEGQIDNSDR